MVDGSLGTMDLEEVAQLQARMLAAIHGGAAQLKTVLSADDLVSILRATEATLRAEPSLVELSVDDPEAQVFVFGDTHGHFPDVAYMLDQLGYPSPKRTFVFNGDYVDRGSWGVELLGLLCCLKCAAPKYVYLLRGNHESSTCTKYYGYSQEVRAKYEKQAKDVYSASKKLFSAMPLAALIQGNTLVMHGGLFRRPAEPKRGAKRRKPSHPGRGGLVPGSLDDLRKATKGGMDPDGCGSSVLATDVLWSDPVALPGFRSNDARGVGLTFGPDITEAFLTANGLRLIIRSHEGPDARDKRTDLPQVLQGYSVDHSTPAGQLMTVFSAPDYPQFQSAPDIQGEGEGQPPGPAQEGGGTAPSSSGPQRYNNLAAVAVLSAPDYATPNMRTFGAVRPRPKADPYYDFASCCDSDAEAPEGGSGSEGGSGAEEEGDEVQGPPAPAEAAMAALSPSEGEAREVEAVGAVEPMAAAVAAAVPVGAASRSTGGCEEGSGTQAMEVGTGAAAGVVSDGGCSGGREEGVARASAAQGCEGSSGEGTPVETAAAATGLGSDMEGLSAGPEQVCGEAAAGAAGGEQQAPAAGCGAGAGEGREQEGWGGQVADGDTEMGEAGPASVVGKEAA